MIKLLDLLKEIGDASTVPYDYRLDESHVERDEDTGEIIEQNFHALYGSDYMQDTGDIYDSQIYVGIERLSDGEIDMEISFGTLEGGQTITDRGVKEAMKVMATVVAVVKEVMKTMQRPDQWGRKPDYISFSPARTGKTDTDLDPKFARQRQKLYTAFINKHFKPKRIDTVNIGSDRTVSVTL